MSASRVTSLVLVPQARDALRAVARTSRSREHGGILVGYRTADAIHVEDALQVDDHTAARTHYLRRSAPADRVLRDYMETVADSYLGYVGEWHTHPQPLPPSPTDRAAMRLMSIRNRQPVALIVAALDADQRNVRLHGLSSEPHSVTARLVGRYHQTAVVHG